MTATVQPTTYQSPQPGQGAQPFNIQPVLADHSQAGLNPQLVDLLKMLLAQSPQTTAQPLQKPAMPAVEEKAEPVNIPFLTAKPQKPARQVFFRFNSGGSMSARYHDVIINPDANCVVLAYDTRWDGDFFIPPETPASEPMFVRFDRDKDKTMLMNYFNIYFNLGCVDFIVLLQAVSPEAEKPTKTSYAAADAMGMQLDPNEI